MRPKWYQQYRGITPAEFGLKIANSLMTLADGQTTSMLLFYFLLVTIAAAFPQVSSSEVSWAYLAESARSDDSRSRSQRAFAGGRLGRQPMIFVAFEMAKKRRARPEVELAGAMAILSAGILEAARDG